MWLGKSDLTDEHLVRSDEGVVYARSVRRLAEHSWSEVRPSSSCRKHHRNRSRQQWTSPLAAEHLALPLAAPEVLEDEKEEFTTKPEEDEETAGGTGRHTNRTPGPSELKQR